MRSLFSLSQEMLALNDALDARGGDLTDAPELVAWHDRLAADLPLALDDSLNLIKEKRMRAAAAKAEAEQWSMKAKAESAGADALERRILAYLQATGQPRAETATGRVVSVVSNGGQLPVELAEGLEPADLPTRFVRYKAEANLTAIREALEAGEPLPFATLKPRGVRLKVS